MKKYLLIPIFLILFCGCNATTEPIQMTIVKISCQEGSWREDCYTLLKSEDGKTARMVGDWGSVGDKISGYWSEGCTLNPNGFSRYK